MSQYSVVIPTKPARIGGPRLELSTVTSIGADGAAPGAADLTWSAADAAVGVAGEALRTTADTKATNEVGAASLLITNLLITNHRRVHGVA
jgi:hypothetical protein